MKNAKLCTAAADIPKTEHWAILRFDSLFIPGIKTLDWDSTSDKTISTLEYWVYANKSDWEDAVAGLAKMGSDRYVAITAKAAKVTSSVIIE